MIPTGALIGHAAQSTDSIKDRQNRQIKGAFPMALINKSTSLRWAVQAALLGFAVAAQA